VDGWSHRNCWSGGFEGAELKAGDLVSTLWFGDEMLGLILECVDSLRPGLVDIIDENTWLVELVDNSEKIHRCEAQLEIVNASR